MFILPFFDLLSVEGTTTTIQKEKIEWVTPERSTLNSNQEKLFELVNLSQIFCYKDNQFTTLTFDTTPSEQEHGIVTIENLFSGNYDIEVNLPIKKAFKVKAKVKSISKFIPKIDIEEI